MRISSIVGVLSLSLLLLLPATAWSKKGDSFIAGDKTFLLSGKPFIVKAAEVHYPRIPRAYWDQRIKMCKALGMNTLCLYVFWNIHEQEEGKFDFTGNNDVAAFCRLAQKNGMYVIVRPGPYVCAEWDMGGLPWWLLKKKDIRLRDLDPYFMERVKLFEQEVGKQLGPLTIGRGGPIIMVQVENEYGAYGENKPYIRAIRDIVKSSGFDGVTLFQCDWTSNFTLNGLDDLVWTMNFGTGANIDGQFKRLGELRPDAPKMCSEFWSGWFDKWGAHHETRPAKDMVAGIDEMLSKGISFSLYMTHGGTSFGHWAGANSPGIVPDVTSYDYDAPINENGMTTPKYFELRKTLQKYSKTKLPAIPKAVPVMTIPKFQLKEFAPIIRGIAKTEESRNIQTMEDLNVGWGSMIYETELPAMTGRSLLTLKDAHDYAQVLVNGNYIGVINRIKNEHSLVLPEVHEGDQLTIVVEAMGRINFGHGIKDYKGITESVLLSGEQGGHEVTYNLKNWQNNALPDDYATAKQAFVPVRSNRAAMGPYFRKAGYYRGTFKVGKTDDTFLNMETWGKGQVYVNGHALGRFWNIGPQQTLYLPGCWLKKGENEIIVLDVVGPKEAVTEGFDKPVLDKLNLAAPVTHRKAGETLDTSTLPMAAEGTFNAGNGWQTVRFSAQHKGRYLAIEGLSAQDGKNMAAIAEVYALDAQGKRLSREAWTAKYADSEDAGGNRTADKVFDLQESTYWSTAGDAKYPHVVVIDMGGEQTVSGVEYLPRAEQGAPGSVKNYRIYVY